ncbi:MAG: GFA family protein [Gammaproteobacteria bacterium]
MPHYEGCCHCGAVKFAFDSEEPITSGLRCNCSICVRRGAVMSPGVIAQEELTIEAADEALGVYQFGDRTARHYFCRNCGIYPFHETARFPGKLRVNLGCIDALDPLAMDVAVFDGKHLL